jgi:hypothetical protein
MNENLREQFNEWDNKNPEVYKLFKRFTFDVINAGHNNYSSRAVVERIRWETSVVTKGDIFKVNNNYTPFYAEKFMSDYPKFKNFFRMRDHYKNKY